MQVARATSSNLIGRVAGIGATGGRVARLTFLLTCISAGVSIVALVVLAIRSAIRLDVHWDFFWYHLPFAAVYGGLPVPYDMNDEMRYRFDGFPPLPELVQGLLWRATGSVNATGVVNFIAFALFLVYCHKVLRAPFWLVALISLTAPMVLIHTTVSYVDLFGNAFLAIGISSCLYLYLFPDRPSTAPLVGGLAGLAAAAWSKYLLVPIVGVMFVLFVLVVLRSRTPGRFQPRQTALILLIFLALAAAPYAKNLAMYHNPFWPERVPVVGALFPYRTDGTSEGTQVWRPAALKGAPQALVFVESLFETRNPLSYPNRLRWTIHDGNTTDAFLMGGFWGAGVVIYLAVTFTMLIAYRRRAGIIASVTGIGLLCLVAVLPQSNELRYFLFIPLTWAAAIAMTYAPVRTQFPRAGVGLLTLVLVLFAHMVSENRTYYQIEKIDYRDAAVAWGAANWWPRLDRSDTYCAVDMMPIGIMMTGPTMSEYTIVDRTKVSLCPPGSIVVTTTGFQGRYHPQ